jgi:DNA-binding transcriptional ArsR family regulator
VADEIRDLARFYKALGDETRLRLVQLLARQEPGRALCVGRLAQEVGVSPSTVSQHLRVLKDLGLARGERRGYRIHYFLDEERLAAYQDLAQERLGEGFAAPTEAPRVNEEVSPMCCCHPKSECAHPEKLKGDPSECTAEQIRECHGEVAEHPCESEEAAEEE